jgi:hypothetical protein
MHSLGQKPWVGLSKLVGNRNGNAVKAVYHKGTAFIEFYSAVDHGNGLNPSRVSDNWNRSRTMNLFKITARNGEPNRQARK